MFNTLPMVLVTITTSVWVWVFIYNWSNVRRFLYWIYLKAPGLVSTKKSIANAGGNNDHHKSLHQRCQRLGKSISSRRMAAVNALLGSVFFILCDALTWGVREDKPARGLSASRGGGDACCRRGRRRRGALQSTILISLMNLFTTLECPDHSSQSQLEVEAEGYKELLA